MGIRSVIRKFRRPILIVIGLICFALGIVGYFTPGLPGTIWLILAATMFVRSSNRLYNLVIQNRFFGRQVKGFLETGEMSVRAKTLSVTSMWVFSIASVILAPYDWRFDIPILLLATAGTIYILSRPTGSSSN